MNTANGASSVLINITDFPEIRDALSGKGPGDTCKLELTVKINEFSENAFRASVTDVVPEGYKRAEDDSEDEMGGGMGGDMGGMGGMGGMDESKAPPIVAVIKARGR